MEWLAAMLGIVAVLSAAGGRRFRPWTAGVALVLCGFATHAVFAILLAGRTGRIEQGMFAVIEATLFLIGLGVVTVDLARGRGGTSRRRRAAAWLLWLAAVAASCLCVLDCLPS